MTSQAMAEVGVYNFEYAGGSFPIHLRTQGRFFCPQYQARAVYEVEGNVIRIDWGKFGKYELTSSDGGRTWAGSYIGEPGNWRKMQFARPFSVAEQCIFDSKWDFEHPGGHFEVEFRADGFNHFICNDFPAHSHWSCVLRHRTNLAQPTVSTSTYPTTHSLTCSNPRLRTD